MKKQCFLGIALMTMLSLNACSVRNVTRGMSEGEHYDAVITVKGNSAAPADKQTAEVSEQIVDLDAGSGNEPAQQLEQLRSLLLKSDEEAAGMFGGGEENRTADGRILVGRNYETQLFGTDAQLYTSYDENQKVGMVFAEFPDGDARQFRKLLTEIAGMEPEVPEEAEGAGWRWNFEDCTVTLYEIYGTLSMDLVPAYEKQQ